MAMVSASSSSESIDLPRSTMIDASPSKLLSSELASASSPSLPDGSPSGDTPNLYDPFSSSPSATRDVNSQSQVVLRSEEYRQLFRLPSEEALVQDFNCACQEGILLQGHMYLFVHYICFYSNIFGFETKKIIPFNEVTSVKRAKTAGIFHNAIEIFAGGKKYFFASFLSRDEAFKLIHDGWLDNCKGVKGTTELQVSISESRIQGNGIMLEKASSSKNVINESDVSTIRDEDPPVLKDPEIPVTSQNGASPSLNNVEQRAAPVLNSGSSSSTKTGNWKQEDSNAPKIPADYTKVAETKFPITLEEFFRLFFSDDAVTFTESFHKRCGDKGAKFGSCQEMQKFRVYRNSHLVIETSQEINDVPYGDYFIVEGLWMCKEDAVGSKEGCTLQVYINVAFSKRTVWKGKIVQSTLEECREAYATWTEMAHELLKQKNLEKQEEAGPTDNSIEHTGVLSEREEKTEERSGTANGPAEHTGTLRMSDREDRIQQAVNLLQESLRNAMSPLASLLRDSSVRFSSFLRSQSCISQVLVVAFAVILLMQVTVLVLLNRHQHIQVSPPMDYYMGSGLGKISDRSADETIAWMEKRVHYLKDEMLMVESRLERMWHEHAVLKAQLKDLEHLRKQR